MSSKILNMIQTILNITNIRELYIRLFSYSFYHKHILELVHVFSILDIQTFLNYMLFFRR